MRGANGERAIGTVYAVNTLGSIIGVILAASVGLGFVNEYRAERAAEALHSGITTVHNWCHNIRTYESGGVVLVVKGRENAEIRVKHFETGQSSEDRHAGWRLQTARHLRLSRICRRRRPTAPIAPA